MEAKRHKLTDRMETKRRKLNHLTDSKVPTSDTTFLSINSDCMYQIFDWLSIDDLCSVSDTCDDFKNVCGEYFSRKYPTKSIILSKNLNREGQSKDKVLNCFKNYIKNMEVCPINQILPILKIEKHVRDDITSFFLSQQGPADYDLLELMPLYSGEHMKNIAFRQVNFPRSFGGEIKNILEKCESIAFLSCNGVANFYNNILSRCKRIKYLAIHGGWKNFQLPASLVRAFPTMEHIEFGSVKATESLVEKLKKFLLLNPSITTFTWHFRLGQPIISDHQFVKVIAQNALNIERLSLSFERYDDLSLICDEIKKLSGRKELKRVEFKFSSGRTRKSLAKHVDRLASLDILKGLHFEFPIDINTFMGTISRLEQLTILQLENVPFCRKWTTISVEKLVNLQELIIKKLESLTFLQQFVRHSPKLKKILIVKCAISLANFNIFGEKTNKMFNEERRKLEAACNMTIFTNNDWKYSELKAYPDFGNDLVRVRYAKFHDNFNFNVNKPFIRSQIDYS